MDKAVELEIRSVIERAYLQGIHGDQDAGKVKNGFHPDFAMLVLKEDALEKVSIDRWLERVEGMKSAHPEIWEAATTCSFEIIDAAGRAAAIKLQVFKGQVHFSTDYMLLYRFEEGWRVVSKIFSVPA